MPESSARQLSRSHALGQDAPLIAAGGKLTEIRRKVPHHARHAQQPLAMLRILFPLRVSFALQRESDAILGRETSRLSFHAQIYSNGQARGQ
jgi:hypothetical protein